MDQLERKGLLISMAGSLVVGCVGAGFAVLSKSQAILLDGLFNLTYFIVGLFTFKVAKLVVQGDDEYFPAGYLFFEPLINGIKGMLILGISVMALWDAGAALLSGGRTIDVGMAVFYGAFATALCWGVVFLLKKKVRNCSSPLLATDAAGWVVNAAISSAAFMAFIGIWLMERSRFIGCVPYLDPALVILVSAITLHVPVRMAWSSLMELVNRSPSQEIRTAVRQCIEHSLEAVPSDELFVRVLQPGRTRLIYVHVILEKEAILSIEEQDLIRAQTQLDVEALHPTSQLDIIFTKERRWANPFQQS